MSTEGSASREPESGHALRTPLDLDAIRFYCTRHHDAEITIDDVDWWDQFSVHVHKGCGDSVLPKSSDRYQVEIAWAHREVERLRECLAQTEAERDEWKLKYNELAMDEEESFENERAERPAWERQSAEWLALHDSETA